MSSTADGPGTPRPQTDRPGEPPQGQEPGSPPEPETTPGTTPSTVPGAPGTTAGPGAPEAAPAPEPAPAAEAREAEIGSVVDPTTVRRAPRFRAFFWLGALVGIVLGAAFGLYLVTSTDPSDIGGPLQKPGVYVTVIMLATTTVTVLLAGLVAILLDRRSLRHRRAEPR